MGAVSLSESFHNIHDKGTAKEIWNSLWNTFAKKGFAMQNYIHRSIKMVLKEKLLMGHSRRFAELIHQLKGVGATVSKYACHASYSAIHFCRPTMSLLPLLRNLEVISCNWTL